jgi:energy-coupling factor transport system substrate-specific component
MWRPVAVVSVVVVLALAIYGALTFAQVAGEIFQRGPGVWSWGSAFLSLGYGFWLVVGGVLWVLGTVFFVLEVFLHRTLSGFRLVDNGVRWDSVDVVIAAMCAAVYGGGLAATGGIVVIPGFTWIRPANMLAPIFGMLFGIPGALGVAVGNFIADLLTGYLSFGSIGGFIGNFILGYVPFKLMRDHSLRTARGLAEFYLYGVLLASVWCSLYISWWLYVFEPLIGLPPALVWGYFAPFVIINNSLATAVAGAPVAYALYPVVKRRGLFWQDRVRR